MTAQSPNDCAPRVVSMGCRLNTYEGEVMRAHARDAGIANAIIVNTCAVTKEAERQGMQAHDGYRPRLGDSDFRLGGRVHLVGARGCRRR